jgi:hypothetical protein
MSKIEQPSRALSTSKRSHLKPQLRHSSIVTSFAKSYGASRAAYDAAKSHPDLNKSSFRLAAESPSRTGINRLVACAPQFSAVTSAFDDLSQPRYDKLWRISVFRMVVSFLFRIRILWINAHGIWYLVGGQ